MKNGFSVPVCLLLYNKIFLPHLAQIEPVHFVPLLAFIPLLAQSARQLLYIWNLVQFVPILANNENCAIIGLKEAISFVPKLALKHNSSRGIEGLFYLVHD